MLAGPQDALPKSMLKEYTVSHELRGHMKSLLSQILLNRQNAHAIDEFPFPCKVLERVRCHHR
jgi:hypothetical protein